MLTNDDWFRLGEISAQLILLQKWEAEQMQWLMSRLKALNAELVETNKQLKHQEELNAQYHAS